MTPYLAQAVRDTKKTSCRPLHPEELVTMASVPVAASWHSGHGPNTEYQVLADHREPRAFTKFTGRLGFHALWGGTGIRRRSFRTCVPCRTKTHSTRRYGNRMPLSSPLPCAETSPC